MQISQVVLFKHIIEEKSISSAAKLCHISQPAASKQMQRLEDELGVQLFERNNRGIELTDAGVIFSEYANRMYEMHYNLTDKMKEWQYRRQTVKIVAFSAVANYVIPCALCKLKVKHPEIAFQIQPMNSSQVVDHVRAGLADVGFAMDVKASEGIVHKPLFDDDIILVAGRNHAIEDCVDVKTLQSFLLVLLDEKFHIYQHVHNVFSKMGYEVESFKNLQKLSAVEGIKSLVINCCGVSFLPRRTVRNELKQGMLREIHLDGFTDSYTMYAVYRECVKPSAVVNEIIDYVSK